MSVLFKYLSPFWQIVLDDTDSSLDINAMYVKSVGT